MTRRREIEDRLALYGDLAGILRAMRSFALAELHRVTRRATTQRDVVATLKATLDDMASVLPSSTIQNDSPDGNRDIWLLLGSVRGFCGSFNEDVMRSWQAADADDSPVVVVGERLAAGLDDGTGRHLAVPGALGSLDAAAVVDRILAGIDTARSRAPGANGLMLCCHDDNAVRCERMMPLSREPSPLADNPPLTLEPPARVAGHVVDHYLFHTLLARLLESIRVENHMRLTQMENALQHLGRNCEELERQRNRLRQEEIVEEIELIAQARAEF